MQASGFYNFDGMEVLFNAVDANGVLNPKDSYTSEWQGFHSNYSRTSVGSDGMSIIGIYGQGGNYITALGFVHLPK